MAFVVAATGTVVPDNTKQNDLHMKVEHGANIRAD